MKIKSGRFSHRLPPNGNVLNETELLLLLLLLLLFVFLASAGLFLWFPFVLWKLENVKRRPLKPSTTTTTTTTTKANKNQTNKKELSPRISRSSCGRWRLNGRRRGPRPAGRFYGVLSSFSFSFSFFLPSFTVSLGVHTIICVSYLSTLVLIESSLNEFS